MTTQSRFRVPKGELGGLQGRLVAAYARRTWGDVPDNAYVLWHNKKVFRAVMAAESKAARCDALDPDLKSYALMASAAVIGCSWCLDFGYYLAHNDGLDVAKVRQVPVWRESTVFTDLERDVMAYAEAMTVTPPATDDRMVQALVDRLGVEAVVELTYFVALENQRSRLNSAMGLATQGFAERCELAPLAT
ncbi:carboxymuconolactone decarboxylase family protein [Nocardioides sp. SYSU DS0651]|uniref:carboxymuconolactone decarboxylase family protein n=1 Tax=Nocardioides sp. SYSU DS0651 TaxID=3415955 RepID=UPI003F4BE775